MSLAEDVKEKYLAKPLPPETPLAVIQKELSAKGEMIKAQNDMIEILSSEVKSLRE